MTSVFKQCVCVYVHTPVTAVLRCVIANIDVTTHWRAVSIATTSDPEGLHGMTELRFLQAEHLSVEQLIQESWTHTHAHTREDPHTHSNYPVRTDQSESSTHTDRGRRRRGNSLGKQCRSDRWWSNTVSPRQHRLSALTNHISFMSCDQGPDDVISWFIH